MKSNIKNTTDMPVVEDKKLTKVESKLEDNKHTKLNTIRVKQNSKILKNKEKTLKKITTTTHGLKSKVDVNKENPIKKSDQISNKKSLVQLEEKKQKLKSDKKQNSKLNLKDDDKINTTISEEVVTTVPTLSNTNSTKKFNNRFVRQISSGSIKEKLLTPKTLSPYKQKMNKSNSNGKFNLTTPTKENIVYKYTERIIKELEENTIDYIEGRKMDFTEFEDLEEFKEGDKCNNTQTNFKDIYKTANMLSGKKDKKCTTMTNLNSKKNTKINNTLCSTNNPISKNNNRPKSDYKKDTTVNKTSLLRGINKTNINLNNTFNTNTVNPVTNKMRPNSSYKKTDIDFKLNEASLSTEASVFRGRIEDYAIGKEIGKGAYAIVKQAFHKISSRKMAIKIYDKVKLLDPQRKNSVKREIQILKRLDHMNIVKLYEVIDHPNQSLLVMELVNGVSLLAFLKSKQNRRIEESECKFIFQQIVRAIDHCHIKNICHRDIKLENIIVEENKNIKLIDFGFGTSTSNNKLLNFFCGTPSYMPPEIVQKRDYIGQSADVWSLGILLYTLLCGAFPFRALTEKELYGKITKGVYNFPDHLSSRVCDLISRILNITPHLRPTAGEILQDAWFGDNQVSLDENFLSNTSMLTPTSTIPKILSEI